MKRRIFLSIRTPAEFIYFVRHYIWWDYIFDAVIEIAYHLALVALAIICYTAWMDNQRDLVFLWMMLLIWSKLRQIERKVKQWQPS